jgi:hypothetical protein
LREISLLRKVFQAQIFSCEGLHTLEILNQIDLLKINDCEELNKIINRSLIVCVDAGETGRFCRCEETDVQFVFIIKSRMTKLSYLEVQANYFEEEANTLFSNC